MTGNSDGVGAVARFASPQGVALDGAGNLYVADFSNRTIRKGVVATGEVTTFAGTAGMIGSSDGIGPAATFCLPTGLVMDAADNLYVADTCNNTVRKVVVATAEVTTLAGTAGMPGSSDGIGAAARFNTPFGLAFDGAGTLYVSDNLSYTIRKVVVATGAVTTLAGTAGMSGSSDGIGAAARFSSPNGVALDGAGNLYIADSVTRTIRVLELSSTRVSTALGVVGQRGVKLGVAPAGLNQPYGLAKGPAGGLVILDESAVLLAH